MTKLKLYGNLDAPDFYNTRDFLRRSVVEYDWTDIAEEPPTIQFPDGEIVVNPSVEDVAKRLGWITQPRYKEYDVSIYGAGPAGLSAAVYAASGRTQNRPGRKGGHRRPSRDELPD
jgi:thioredoxin reductase (NADPH)